MIIINLFFAVVLFFLLLLLYVIIPPDSPWAPWWRTNKKTAKAIGKLVEFKKKDFVYDLGCGDGEALVEAGRMGSRGIGIEIDPIRVWIARFKLNRKGLNKNIEIKRKNFFDEDISRATVVIVYLVPETLNKLMPKFKKELKKGTRIVSYRYRIEKLKIKNYDNKNNLYLYVI